MRFLVGSPRTCERICSISSPPVSARPSLSPYPFLLFPAHLPDILLCSSVPQSDEIVPNPKLPSAPATSASHCPAVWAPQALQSRHHDTPS
jgi:hypothetical protein